MIRVKFGIRNVRNRRSVGVHSPASLAIKQGKRGTNHAPLREHAACLEAGAILATVSNKAFRGSVKVRSFNRRQVLCTLAPPRDFWFRIRPGNKTAQSF